MDLSQRRYFIKEQIVEFWNLIAQTKHRKMFVRYAGSMGVSPTSIYRWMQVNLEGLKPITIEGLYNITQQYQALYYNADQGFYHKGLPGNRKAEAKAQRAI